MLQTLGVFDRVRQSTVCHCGLCNEVFGRRFEQLLSVIALVVLKCLFIISMCQRYLCTITLFSFNYVWYFSVTLFNLSPATEESVTWRPVLSKRDM